MMGFWRRLGWRWRASRVRSEGPLRGVVEAGMPDMAQPLSKARLLALDLEMTGLDAKRDAIVSIGFVPVDGRTIVMSGARRFLVQVEGSVGHSATIHGIRDVDLQRGAMPLTQALELTLEALSGRALLAHHAPLELGFLGRATQALYGCRLPVVAVDTLVLAQRRYARPTVVRPGGFYRLGALRAHVGLPRYGAHDALTDALATAELFLALTAREADRQRLGDVVV